MYLRDHFSMHASFTWGITAHRRYVKRWYSCALIFAVLFVGWTGLVPQAAQAQDIICTGRDITLETQSQINDFQAEYAPRTGGPCTRVGGNLRIEDDNDGIDPITSLSGLGDLTFVVGGLSVRGNGNLMSLDGLNGITTVSNLTISENGNPALTSLDGLNSLAVVHADVDIINNAALTSLNGLENLTGISSNVRIRFNDALESLTGLEGLTEVRVGLGIHHNVSLESLDGLNNIISVGRDLSVIGNSALENLDGLAALTTIGDDLRLWDNAVLTDISGLAGVTSVGGTSTPAGATAATAAAESLSAPKVGSIGGNLVVRDNDQLSDCRALYDLLTDPGAIGGTVTISGNAPDGQCNSEDDVLAAGPLPPSSCQATTLTESAPRVGSDGLGRIDVTFSNTDGIAEIAFTKFQNFVLETVSPDASSTTTGPTLTFASAPDFTGASSPVTVTLRQADATVDKSVYFAVASSVCPAKTGGLLETDFDPPVDFTGLVPRTFALASPYPNPSSGPVNFAINVPEPTSLRLTVYDIMGRHVATLAEGPRQAGRHTITWNGRAETGRTLASGVYLVRMQAGPFTQVRRLTLIR